MEDILICSQNPIFVKSLHGILCDAGLGIEVADHPSLSISMILRKQYAAVVVDAEQPGLSAEETIRIIRSITPDMPIIVVGPSTSASGELRLKMPLDLEEFRRVIQHISRFHKISHHKEEKSWQ